MEPSYIDLHVHSNASDGTFSPEELIRLAVKSNLAAIALTDHDTTDGLPGACRQAEESGIELVPGIELSTDYNGTEVHILGFFIDRDNPVFSKKLQEFQDSRLLRNQKMAEKLRQTGFDISMEQLSAAYPDCTLTRAHFARYLTDQGYVESMDTVFSKYLGNGKSCYVPREKITPYQALDLIRSGGGLSCFAHPILCRMNHERLDYFVKTLAEHGMTGLEAIYPQYTPGEERYIRRLAGKYGLLISGGSDFHGLNRPSIQLGIGKGSMHIPYLLLEQMKNRLL